MTSDYLSFQWQFSLLLPPLQFSHYKCIKTGHFNILLNRYDTVLEEADEKQILIENNINKQMPTRPMGL